MTAGTVNVDTLVKQIARGIENNPTNWDGTRSSLAANACAALSDLAARAREVDDWPVWRARAESAEADRDRLRVWLDEAHKDTLFVKQERDRLARRVAELEQEREASAASEYWVPRHRLESADRRVAELEAALRDEILTIDRWDATIGQPPDPPSADEVLFAVRDRLRALAGDGGGA
jgi:hypothetical protein